MAKKKTSRKLVARTTCQDVPVTDLAELSRIVLLDSQVSRYEGEVKFPLQLEVHNNVSLTGSVKSGKVIANVTQKLRAKDNSDNGITGVSIDAKYSVFYSIEGGSTREKEVTDFIRYNCLMSLWPYWREYVQTTTTRMGMPPLTLPFLRLSIAGESDTNITKKKLEKKITTKKKPKKKAPSKK